MTGAYYNEIDPGAAAWLRELIRRGLIADGEVDERSIEDVRPAELLGYSQCHFFAGIGGWSYALRLAGWPDDRPVWTGSCPCQPFSPAGKGAGFADERHLWPAFHWLIAQCGPDVVFGEQVAGKDGLAWLDLVSTDLEALGYACGAVPFPAAGIGAPHIRERLYWMADTKCFRSAPRLSEAPGRYQGIPKVAGDCSDRRTGSGARRPSAGGMANAFGADGLGEHRHRVDGAQGEGQGGFGQRERLWPDPAYGGAARGMDNATSTRHLRSVAEAERDPRIEAWLRLPGERHGSDQCGGPGPTNGHWGTADWLGCRDDRWRPVEPGSFPLAHGLPARVGRLRGYGNAIVATQAATFVQAYLEAAA